METLNRIKASSKDTPSKLDLSMNKANILLSESDSNPITVENPNQLAPYDSPI
jgi:hypothetical protein